MILNKLKKYVSKNVYEIFTKHEFCYIRASTIGGGGDHWVKEAL